MPLSKPGSCVVCGRPLTLHQAYAGGVCGDWRCRERVLRDALIAQRSEAGRARGIEAVEAYPVAVVPWREVANCVPVPEEQRDDFERFLRELLAANPAGESQSAQDGAKGSPPPDSDVVPAAGAIGALLATVCAVCRGFCCFYGATRHAFVDTDTLAAFRRRDPGASDDAVAAAYLALVPVRHCAGSCVYHTQAGCALPRDMRARICNTYECRGLKDARAGYAAGAGARACVVVRHDNRIMGSAFVGPEGMPSSPPEQ